MHHMRSSGDKKKCHQRRTETLMSVQKMTTAIPENPSFTSIETNEPSHFQINRKMEPSTHSCNAFFPKSSLFKTQNLITLLSISQAVTTGCFKRADSDALTVHQQEIK